MTEKKDVRKPPLSPLAQIIFKSQSSSQSQSSVSVVPKPDLGGCGEDVQDEQADGQECCQAGR